MKLPHLPLGAPLLALATLLLTACETGPDRHAMMEEARHSIPPMAANDTFFDGQIAIHLTLGGNMSEGGLMGDPDGRRHGGKMTGMGDLGESKFGGGMGSGDALEGGRNRGGTYQGNEGMSKIPENEDPDSAVSRRRRESEMPPALLRLRLENTTPATVVVEVRELNSELGNFAVRPDTVTLAPGQTVEVDPMQSLLGVDSFSLPVSITLRAGGQTQTKVVTLRPIPRSPDTPPPPPPAH